MTEDRYTARIVTDRHRLKNGQCQVVVTRGPEVMCTHHLGVSVREDPTKIRQWCTSSAKTELTITGWDIESDWSDCLGGYEASVAPTPTLRALYEFEAEKPEWDYYHLIVGRLRKSIRWEAMFHPLPDTPTGPDDPLTVTIAAHDDVLAVLDMIIRLAAGPTDRWEKCAPLALLVFAVGGAGYHTGEILRSYLGVPPDDDDDDDRCDSGIRFTTAMERAASAYMKMMNIMYAADKKRQATIRERLGE